MNIRNINQKQYLRQKQYYKQKQEHDRRKKILSLKNIKKISNGTTILDDVSVDFYESEMVGIYGESGAGKTSLLNIIGCFDNDFTGHVLMEDINIENLSSDQKANIRNKKIGFVVQDFSLIEEMTVYDNVALTLLFDKSVSFVNIRSKIVEALDKVGMKKYINKKIKLMSGGEKQRIAIARAIVNEPDILIADEPTGALDSKNTQKIMELFLQLNKQFNTTVILVSHDMNCINMCYRKIKMEDGHIESDE
ncbi:ABC transporter ATP-binding protein [Lachnobacterium bovis]|uniref:ABC transporter ATP-binding protein n=1 Tax=Lachnobacterium bovis TaxID=140626 RepID=UPI0009E545B2|nr:ABC transporter ATP-binding protein [Lachnobacterium bovis]